MLFLNHPMIFFTLGTLLFMILMYYSIKNKWLIKLLISSKYK